MTTGAENWIIAPTRLTKSTDLKDRFQDVIRQTARDHLEKVYPDDGVFDARLTFAAAVDLFALVGTSDATDGDGNVLSLPEATDDGSAVAFENTVATSYYVALRSIERSAGIQVNPRTGRPEYERLVEDIGELGPPDSVSDLGGTIQFNINSLVEANVDHSGRSVRVYLNTPADNATTEPVAIETVLSTYSAPNNIITTTGQLGQTIVSTNPADYTVIVLGPTVRRDTDLRLVDGIVFLGIVTGGGAGNPPTAFDVSDQNLIDVTLSGFNAALDAFITGVDRSVEAATKPIVGERTAIATAVQRTDAIFYDGSIYVMGGLNAAAAEVHDNVALNVVSDVWAARTAVPSQSNGGPAADGRQDARMVELGGIIYYMGGLHSGTYVELVQRYDVGTDTWLTPAADLPIPLSAGAVGVINGRIYYAGGFTTAGAAVSNTYEYDPGTDLWTEVANLTTIVWTNVGLMGFAVLRDRLYLVGGNASGFDQAGVAVYDPAVDTWTLLTDIPRFDYSNNTGSVTAITCEVVNDVLHAFGGDWLGAGDHTRAHMMYNVDLDEWYIADDAGWPGATYHASAVDDDGLIYLIGGEVNDTGSTLGVEVRDTVAAFDASNLFLAANPGIATLTGKKGDSPATHGPAATNPHTGNAIPDIPAGARHAMRACTLHGQIFLSGGQILAGTMSDSLEMYCPETNAWTALADMIAPRGYHAFVSDEETDTLWLWHGESATGTERDEIYKYEVNQNDWLLHDDTSSIFRSRGAFGRIGKTLVHAGGTDSVGAEVDDLFFYDINMNTVTGGANLTVSKSDGSLLIVPNGPIYDPDIEGGVPSEQGFKMYFAGGYNGVNALSTMDVYYSGNDARWHQVTGILGTVRMEHAAALVENDNGAKYMALIGGNDNSALVTTIELFYLNALWDGSAGTAALVTGRNQPAAAAVDGYIYVFGGSDFAAATMYDTVESYGFGKGRRLMLENYSAQRQLYENPVAMKHRKRESVAFRTGQIWGVGTWHPTAAMDYVRVGE